MMVRHALDTSKDAFYYDFHIIDRQKLTELRLSGVGEYFLQTFPDVERNLLKLDLVAGAVDVRVRLLENTIRQSDKFIRAFVGKYAEQLNVKKDEANKYEKLNFDRIVDGMIHLTNAELARNASFARETFVRFCIAALLAKPPWPGDNTTIADNQLWNFSREQVSLLNSESTVMSAINETKILCGTLESELLRMRNQLKQDRIELAARYTATFGPTK